MLRTGSTRVFLNGVRNLYHNKLYYMLINCFRPVCIDHKNKEVYPRWGLIVYVVEILETYSTFDFPWGSVSFPYVGPPMFLGTFAFLTSTLLKQGYRYYKLHKGFFFSKFYYRHSELFVEYYICLKTNLQQGIS